MIERTQPPGSAPFGVRAAGAALALALSGGTGFVGLVLAWLIAYNNCEDGCAPGSRFALGAWGTYVELWFLFVPALVMALVLILAIAAGWRRAAQTAWVTMTTLFVTWSVFTLLIAQPLCLGGLIVLCGGGLCGIRIAFPGALRIRHGDPPSSS